MRYGAVGKENEGQCMVYRLINEYGATVDVWVYYYLWGNQ